ncbi:ABC transporter ATP-binding protein [Tianweitania sp. BSSL-BM11]|uniref:ABC transporter ATP-binding protein n=1 Tax=Tianweitania aestuarii TaxID=2814886 RepID=A0ABS5RQQ3_9HYPH|nr:ABC transporter ATP-binding protein [Tianweitania aestuarii]MBS9719378.1 ABC transporter ATP-binding protein [Tianweitania aestuarii]
MTTLRLDGLTRIFGTTRAVDHVSMALAPGSFTALLGPSGCGKTTLLRLIAGFEAPDEGSISFDGKVIADAKTMVPPEQRGIGIVFQSYALWPHMDVAGNVAYPLQTQRAPRDTIKTRVAEVLDIVGLGGFQSRRIDELSGGQRQRVALARCLIANSGIILFDEPLANLDMHLRATMVDVFRDIHQRTGATIVYVTHDQAEALAMADRVAVLDKGRVLQFAAPTDVYHQPSDVAVARFVGRGAIVPTFAWDSDQTQSRVQIGGHTIVARSSGVPEGAVNVLLRPEGLALADDGVPGTVLASTYRGPVHELRIKLAKDGGEVTVDHRTAIAPGTVVKIAVQDAWIIPAARL